MQSNQFENLCIDRLGYASNPWEIEHVRASKKAASDPWVSCNVSNIQDGTVGK